MYEDLADAVETMKENGFEHTFELEGEFIVCEDLGVNYTPDDVNIIEAYRHERATDPGTDATVFALQSISGIKGLLVVGYGKYADPEKAKIIDKLLKAHEESD